MFIKQVIIHGFKSYRDRTVVEPFDKQHNVVVGRNGSGKSNFFCAIQFILTDEFSHLRTEQRQMLLHENSGAQITNAYVEVILDNTDRRIPIASDEIFLRRIIGLQKDQYILNKKIATRSEVMNLLESAGFTNSNPYYIVKQGTINQMALAPDSRRLELLHEVAGTKLYIEKRIESIKVLKNAEKRLVKIEESLSTLEEKLNTLKEQKEDLKQYQHYNKTKNAIEYCIRKIELDEYKTKIKFLEEDWNTSSFEQGKQASNLKKVQEQIHDLTRTSTYTKNRLNAIKEERDNLYNEMQSLMEEHVKLDLTVNDLRDEMLGDKQSKKNFENELAQLELTIKEQESELEKIKPQFEAMRRKENESIRDLTLKTQKQKELFAKQERGSYFTIKEERDRWIQNELKSLNNQIKEKKKHIDNLSGNLKLDVRKQADLSRKIEEQTHDIDKQRILFEQHNKQCYELKRSKDQQQTIRNELWRKENTIQQYYSSLKEDLINSEQSLRLMTGKAILNGCDSVRKVLKTFQERGGPDAEIVNSYFGLVIENLNCDKSVYTAVEVTAKNKLFNHIVKNDHTATRILKEMKQQKLPGEVTFAALNRLNPREFEYPQNDEDSVALIYKLNYDKKYEKVMKYIFGNTLICRSLEVATKLARRIKLDCVTLGGDQVSSSGILTGGYINTSHSKLKIQITRNELMEKIRECENELKIVKENIAKTESIINNLISEMQQIEIKKSKLSTILDQIKREITLIKQEISNTESYRVQKEQSLYQVKSQFEQLQSTKENFELELKQELSSKLSTTDQEIFESLKADIVRLKKEHKEAFGERTKLEEEKNKFSNLLNNNLIKRREQIQKDLEEITMIDREGELKNVTSVVEENVKSLEKAKQDLEVLEKKISENHTKLEYELQELDKYQKIEKNTKIKFDEDAKQFQKIDSKKTLLVKKICEFTENINQLDALPSKIDYEKYTNMTLNELFRELKKTNNHLKKYSHVNKKALEQFIQITNEKESFKKQQEELSRGHEKIEELLDMLEQKKMEAIHFTFRQISQYFREIFKKLAPSGRAKLLMKTIDNKDGREIGPEDTDADLFTGIAIKVTFTDSDVEMKEMNQLSGGQKSLVALSLIFAIQKCDPAPFYLFDEIDQALDAEHRQAVAKMIQELSDKAQFITSTFRPDLLQHANKCYGVTFSNNVSQIRCVTKEEAREFVEHDQTKSWLRHPE